MNIAGYEGPGIYQHYKGGYYRVLGVAQSEYCDQRFVIYHSYSVPHDLARLRSKIDFVARPLNSADGPDAFNESIRVDFGEHLPRFHKVV